ncbi:MAG: hypothetical protein LBM28_05100 [Oscillospiraceae bacterium]|jgi:uncharacterized YccA/Bax inhibitor family protein|nr:hypothetical protein [Oscillospiraceae bacterium]
MGTAQWVNLLLFGVCITAIASFLPYFGFVRLPGNVAHGDAARKMVLDSMQYKNHRQKWMLIHLTTILAYVVGCIPVSLITQTAIFGFLGGYLSMAVYVFVIGSKEKRELLSIIDEVLSGNHD